MTTQLLYTVQDSDKTIVFASVSFFEAADKAKELNAAYPILDYGVYEHDITINTERCLNASPAHKLRNN